MRLFKNLKSQFFRFVKHWANFSFSVLFAHKPEAKYTSAREQEDSWLLTELGSETLLSWTVASR